MDLFLYILGLVCGAILFLLSLKRAPRCKGIPGPFPLPLLGNLHQLRHYKEMPYEAFTKLGDEFGDVFSLRMGNSNAVVVRGSEAIKEVLLSRAEDFSDRPDFARLIMLFGGKKDNALAFCDSSRLQEARRSIIKRWSVPSSTSHCLQTLNNITSEELGGLISVLLKETGRGGPKVVDLKSGICKSIGNIFIRYFTQAGPFSYSDPSYRSFIRSFDAVFWEVNNGRLCDFLPFLYVFLDTSSLQRHTNFIRSFVHNRILNSQFSSSDVKHHHEEEDTFLASYASKEPNMDLLLYALEDLIGGHSAVGNMVLRVLRDVLNGPTELLDDLRKEIGPIRHLGIDEAKGLPLLNACVYESIRMTASPIIPHRAKRDTRIGKYTIPKGTDIFINNHHSHYSPSLWDDPQSYNPSRFIHPSKGTLIIPGHFTPFSVGRRSCIGYKLTLLLTAAFSGEILRVFNLSNVEEASKLPKGMLASKPGPFKFEMRALVEE